MNNITLFLVSLWLFLLIVGQMLFKYVSIQLNMKDFSAFAVSLICNVKFWLAISIYGVATVLWVIILRQIPLSKALPFTALSFILIPILSKHLWHENIHWHYWLGVLCIVLGLAITTNSVK